MRMLTLTLLAAMLCGCKSYTVDVAADGSKHINLTNLGFDTKLDGLQYKHADSEFNLQGYGSDSQLIPLVTELVKHLPPIPIK